MAENAVRSEAVEEPPPREAVARDAALGEPVARDNVHVLPARYVGHVDTIESGFVRGWARDEASPDARTDIDVYLGERHVGSTTADRYREDLMSAGVGDGRHAFIFALPPEARDAPTSSVGVYFRGTRIPLVRTQAMTPIREPEPGLAELQELTLAVRAGMERVATRVAALGRDQTQLAERVTALQRELEQRSAGSETERRRSVEAAAIAVKEETAVLSRRVEAIEKSFADVDAFLVRIDGSLRRMADAPPPKAGGSGLALALAIFAVLASGLSILAAISPAGFTALLKPIFG